MYPLFVITLTSKRRVNFKTWHALERWRYFLPAGRFRTAQRRVLGGSRWKRGWRWPSWTRFWDDGNQSLTVARAGYRTESTAAELRDPKTSIACHHHQLTHDDPTGRDSDCWKRVRLVEDLSGEGTERRTDCQTPTANYHRLAEPSRLAWLCVTNAKHDVWTGDKISNSYKSKISK